MPTTRRAQSGFSLIELMIAILILFAGIVSVAQLVPTAMRSNFRNRNDSTALIVAQRELAQMAQQTMEVQNIGACATAAPASSYYFCDQDGDTIALGSTGSTTPSSDGCPLLAGGALDFSTACPAGYSVKKTWVWNPVENINYEIELRWRIVTRRSGTTPVRKVIIIGARAGTAAQGYLVTNLQTVVGRK